MKNFRKPFTLIVIFMFVCLNIIAPVKAEEANMSVIKNFMGRSNAANDDNTSSIGWERVTVNWDKIEPRVGTVDQKALDTIKTKVLQNKRQGKNVLLMLDAPPIWAVNGESYRFEKDGIQYDMGEWEGVKYGEMLRNLTTYDDKGEGTMKELTFSSHVMPIASKELDSWKDFVELVVQTFSQDSYNVKYYQIYNQPFGKVEDFYGTTEQFVNEIHKPAADIIHKYGCKVVSGGLSKSVPIDRFVSILDDTKAWDSIDVFNLYYNTLGSINYLYEEAKKHGKNEPSIWETETGFDNPGTYIPNFYPRVFHWALSHWSSDNPDQFKLFWSETASNDTKLLLSDKNKLTKYGKEISALEQLLSGKTIEIFKNYSLIPDVKFSPYENDSSTEAFLIDGKKVVIAANMIKENTAAIFAAKNEDTLHLDFTGSLIDMNISGVPNDASVQRVTVLGTGWDIHKKWDESGRLYSYVAIPDKLNAPAVLQNELAENVTGDNNVVLSFYVRIESDTGIRNDVPEPENETSVKRLKDLDLGQE